MSDQELTPRDVLGVARLRVQKREPYFTSALFSLRLIETPGLGTLGIDEQYRMHYDPVVIDAWGLDALTTVMAHQIRHPVLDHWGRSSEVEAVLGSRIRAAWGNFQSAMRMPSGRQPQGLAEAFNLLEDCEINSGLADKGWEFPSAAPPVMPEMFNLPRGESFEEYVAEVLRRAENQEESDEKQEGNAPDGDQRGDCHQHQTGGNDRARSELGQGGSRVSEVGEAEPRPAGVDDGGRPGEWRDNSPGTGAGDAGGTQRPGSGGACGGCAGNPQAGEVGSAADVSGAASQERKLIARLTAQAIQAEASRLRGSVPASLQSWANELLKPPVVPWQRVILARVRGAITEASGQGTYSYRRQNRRAAGIGARWGRDVLLPAQRQPVPRTGVVLDVSGSMGYGEGSPAQRASSEVLGIARAMRSPVTVWVVDAAVAAVKRVSGEAEVGALGRTGGGTDMRVGITAAAEARCDVVVVVTDGWTPWPSAEQMPRRARLVVAVIGDAVVPDYIEHVRVSQE